jgi:hypothetical protein
MAVEFEQQKFLADGSCLWLTRGRRTLPRVLLVGRSNYFLVTNFVSSVGARLSGQGLNYSWFEFTDLHLRRRLQFIGRPGRLGNAARYTLAAAAMVRYPLLWPHLRPSPGNNFISTQGRLASLRRGILALGPPEDTVVIAHSLGARMASAVADGLGLRGLVSFAYPFRVPGAALEPERYSHLKTLKTRMLIFQGDQDTFGNYSSLGSYALSPQIAAHCVEADHHTRLGDGAWDAVFATIAGEFWPPA